MEITGDNDGPIKITRIDEDMDPKEAANIYAQMLSQE